ncbi:hypothetical protein MPRM_04000 [Mycobacterium parmense]|uniref:DUF3618 domain-containing protein n=1 Tax=Mycobacterium parmense TaxID=185642 RepID=A0A7I7YN59_9MYCO|nr:hypothetical protein MPRM_04000 [Mycobacterium parmense]
MLQPEAGDLEDRDVADRDPETIKQEIDQARDQLAATVDSLAERANPRRLADDLKARAVEFVKKPVVIVSLVGISSVVAVVVVRRIRDR